MRRRTVVAALSLSALTAVTGCGRGSARPAEPFTVVTMKSSAGQAEILLKPKGPVVGLVLFAHGYGETEKALLRVPPLFPLRDALLSNGFAMTASYSHGNNLGREASIEDQLLLLRDAEKRLPSVPSVDMVGFSMGGLDALLAASRHILPGLHAVVVLSGMCNQIPFLNTSLGPPIRRAFGNKRGQALIAALSPDDPEKQSPQSYAGYRYWLWQSPVDRTVPPAQATSMAAILRRGGASVQLSWLSGNHGDLSKLPPAVIVRFFQT